MGQASVCEPQRAIGGEQGDLLPREAGVGPLYFCSCIPATPYTLQECYATSRRNGKTEKVGLEDDNFGSDFGSDIDSFSARMSHLVLARHRLFSPHLQCKFASYYQTERKVGEGSYGNVYEAIARPVSVKDGRPVNKGKLEVPPTASSSSSSAQRYVAVKAFSLEKVKQEDKEKAMREVQGRRASFEAERAILSQLEHPHIIKMYECYEEKSALYIVLELCRGGELYERIAAKARSGSGGGLDEKTSRHIFKQMLLAASYLHANRVVHRDIKSENFLLLGEPGSQDAETIKLCDFGTAAVLSDQKPRSMERIGTLSYTAPEIYANRGASVVADNWSLGVVLYVLLVGASPFRTSGNETREETMRRIQHGDFEVRRPAWQNLTHLGQELVKKFLVVQENNRLTSKKALRHPWVDVVPGGVDGARLSSLRASSSLAVGPDGAPPGGGEPINFSACGQTVVTLLERFTRLDAMQQLVLIICAQTMSEQELINCVAPVPWYDLFFALDRNEDGQLSFQEFSSGIKQLLGSSMVHSDDQLDSLVRALDLDCSGQIEWIEWAALALLAVQGLVQEPEPLATAFRLLDRPSGDGTVGAADLLAVINSDAKSMCITSTAGREQVLRILSRWVSSGQNSSRKENTNAPRNEFVAPPSLKLEDMRKVLEACSNEDNLLALPMDAYPRKPVTNWCRPSPGWGCPSEQSGGSKTAWCPDSNTELSVMVQQQRAVPVPRGKSPQKKSSSDKSSVKSSATTSMTGISTASVQPSAGLSTRSTQPSQSDTPSVVTAPVAGDRLNSVAGDAPAEAPAEGTKNLTAAEVADAPRESQPNPQSA